MHSKRSNNRLWTFENRKEPGSVEIVVDKKGYQGTETRVISVVSHLTVDLTRLSATIASEIWVTKNTSVRVSSSVKGSWRIDTVLPDEGDDRHWKLTSGML